MIVRSKDNAVNQLDFAAIRAKAEGLRTEALCLRTKTRIMRIQARIIRAEARIIIAQIHYINENPYIIRARSEFEIDTNKFTN